MSQNPATGDHNSLIRSADTPSPSAQGQMVPQGPRNRHRRSGCATCRRRRVRCDERKDVCGNCTRLGLSCSWYHTAELTQRSRVNNACERCRKKKIRCTSAWSSEPCDPCQSSGSTCIHGRGPQSTLRDAQQGSEMRTVAAGTAGMDSPNPTLGIGGEDSTESLPKTDKLQLPDRARVQQLIGAYFDGPHYYCYYTFIHQPTLQQMFDNDLVPRFLLLVIIATSLHFLEPENNLSNLWANEARRLLMVEIFSPPSTTTLQALLLLQRYEWHRASHVSAWFLSGLAVRLGHGLQINLEILDRNRVPATIRETRRRLAWSCFVMESMIEGGRKAFSGIDASSIEVRVPCDERSFQLGLETHMPGVNQLIEDYYAIQQGGAMARGPLPTPNWRPGISAFMVKLATLRRDILNYTLPYHPRNKGHIPSALPWVGDSPFYGYEEKLDQWHESLPEELQLRAQVMYSRQRQLTSYVTLHCLFHGCYCDLYRLGSYILALRRNRDEDAPLATPSQSFLATCRRGRLQHAFAICKVIYDSMQHGCTGHDPVVGISAALAMRVLVIERRQEDSEALGLTDEAIRICLDAAVQCAKEISRRSIPIRDLFFSVCAIAAQRGYHVDLTGIGSQDREQGAARASKPDTGRSGSPSLRTYGTFGSIQSSLATRQDILAPPVASQSERESDLFSNFGTSGTDIDTRQIPNGYPDALDVSCPLWELDPMFSPFESFSPNSVGFATGWGDGTLNFSMLPSQFDWINQGLGFEFG